MIFSLSLGNSATSARKLIYTKSESYLLILGSFFQLLQENVSLSLMLW